MVRALLFLIVMSTVGHAQQIIDWYSSIWIDSGTGQITGIGNTVVIVNYDPNIDTIVAGAVTSVQGYATEASNKCGIGCAQALTYGQVNALGATYWDNSDHSGTVDYADGEYFFEYETSAASWNVPSAPSIYVSGINANNPHYVQWRYGISGYEPAGLNFTLGDNFLISTPPGSSGAFYVDQMSYPQGYNYAYLTSSMYGIAIGGAACLFLRNDNYTEAPPASSQYVLDGTTLEPGVPGYINVRHIVADLFTYFKYDCVAPDAGALLDTIGTFNNSTASASTGSVDTSGNFAANNTTIFNIGEVNNHGGLVDTLGPVTHLTDPQQSKTFMSRELDYPLGTWWFPTDFANMYVCNTTLTLADTNSGTGTYTTVPLGCIQIPLP